MRNIAGIAAIPNFTEISFSEFAFEVLQPGHAVLGGEVGQDFFRLSEFQRTLLRRIVRGELAVFESDADDFEAAVVIFAVVRDDIGQFRFARAAPRRSKIHEHDLAAQLGEIDLTAVDRGEGNVQRFLEPTERFEFVGGKFPDPSVRRIEQLTAAFRQ